jgi:hypothetical protein
MTVEGSWSMENTMHLFLDTNSLLHYPAIKDVDWKMICRRDSVRLVLCMQVIHELDEKKDDPRLSDRANRIIKVIKTIKSAGGAVRDGVTLSIFNNEIKAAEFPASLSIDSKDDRIVHSVKKYLEENAGAPVAMYTEDMGMNLRCEANGVTVVEPDSQRRLENPQDEQTKKYRHAITELNSLKNRLPILALHGTPTGEAPQPGKPITFELKRTWKSLDVQFELAKVQHFHPKHVEPAAPPPIAFPPVSLPAILAETISSEDWTRYNARIGGFYFDYEVYLTKLNTWGEIKDRTIVFDVWLQNTGNSPAEDIDVFLRFPTSLRLVLEVGEDRAKTMLKPKEPVPPIKPKPRSPLLPGYDHSAFTLPQVAPIATQIANAMARKRNFVEVFNDDQQGHCIHGKAERLKHGGWHRVGSFLGVFGAWDQIAPFEAEFTISASELPDKTIGKIPFIVRNGGRS